MPDGPPLSPPPPPSPTSLRLLRRGKPRKRPSGSRRGAPRRAVVRSGIPDGRASRGLPGAALRARGRPQSAPPASQHVCVLSASQCRGHAHAPGGERPLPRAHQDGHLGGALGGRLRHVGSHDGDLLACVAHGFERLMGRGEAAAKFAETGGAPRDGCGGDASGQRRFARAVQARAKGRGGGRGAPRAARARGRAGTKAARAARDARPRAFAPRGHAPPSKTKRRGDGARERWRGGRGSAASGPGRAERDRVERRKHTRPETGRAARRARERTTPAFERRDVASLGCNDGAACRKMPFFSIGTWSWGCDRGRATRARVRPRFRSIRPGSQPWDPTAGTLPRRPQLPASHPARPLSSPGPPSPRSPLSRPPLAPHRAPVAASRVETDRRGARARAASARCDRPTVLQRASSSHRAAHTCPARARGLRSARPPPSLARAPVRPRAALRFARCARFGDDAALLLRLLRCVPHARLGALSRSV